MHCKMWTDRELDEHHVFDHNKANGGANGGMENGGSTITTPGGGGGSVSVSESPLDPYHGVMDPNSASSANPVANGVGVGVGMDHHHHHFMEHSSMLEHLDGNGGALGAGYPGSGGAEAANETSMMMMMPPPPTQEELNHHQHHQHHVLAPRDDVKLPTAKEKDNYLKRYARKFGLNDRGCYVSCCLAILAFFLFLIVVAMAASWPGE